MKRFLRNTLLALVVLALLCPCALAQENEFRISIFGASTRQPNDANIQKGQYCRVSEQEDGAVVIESVGASGKLADHHDGIAYYYAKIPAEQNCELSAKVTLLYQGTDGKGADHRQQSFGIMARDVPGIYEGLADSKDGYANIIALAPYDLKQPLQAIRRTGVHAGAKLSSELTEIEIEKQAFLGGYPKVGETYEMCLKKTNTGWHLLLTDPATGAETEKIYYDIDHPNLLLQQDPQYYYVGFFAARDAKIEVRDIALVTSLAANDPPAQEKPIEYLVPELNIQSADKTGNDAYTLSLSSNFAGTLSVSRTGEMLAENVPIEIGVNDVPITLKPGKNSLLLTIVPEEEGQYLTSYNTITKVISVEQKTLGEGDMVYAAPDGSAFAKGTQTDPVSLPAAVSYARAGQTILLSEGTYRLNDRLLIAQAASGTAENPVKVIAQGDVTLDFGKTARGVSLYADYWQITGIAVTGSSTTGMRVLGDHNTISRCVFYENAGTGLAINGDERDTYDRWPHDNTVYACESYSNRDVSDGDADGFSANIACGAGNVFDACIAHHNSDDGWDLYTRSGTKIGETTIRNCVTYQNGFAMDGTPTLGDGNGFKLGGESMPVKHTIRNCAAWQNRVDGFTANSNPTFVMESVTSFANGRSNFVFAQNVTDYAVSGALSVDGGKADENVQNAAGANNAFSDAHIKESIFASIDAPKVIARDADGAIALGDFLRIEKDSYGADLAGSLPENTAAPTSAPAVVPAPTPQPEQQARAIWPLLPVLVLAAGAAVSAAIWKNRKKK